MALSDNLIAYWSLDEASGTRADSHGSNDLADNNTVGSATGLIGTAADFERDDSEYLSISDNADLSVGDIDFTMACWVKLESLPASVALPIAQKANGTNFAYGLNYNTAASRFRWRVSSASGFTNLTNCDANTFGAASTGVWYFVVAWHDATANTLNIQVNDGTVDSVAYSVGSYDDGASFRIGGYSDFGEYFDGLIDEVGFWKRVLTSGERTDLYNSGAGRDYAYITGGGGGFIDNTTPVLMHIMGSVL